LITLVQEDLQKSIGLPGGVAPASHVMSPPAPSPAPTQRLPAQRPQPPPFGGTARGLSSPRMPAPPAERPAAGGRPPTGPEPARGPSAGPRASFDEEPTRVADDSYAATQMKLIENAWENQLDASSDQVTRVPPSEFDDRASTLQARDPVVEFEAEASTRRAP